MTDQEERCGHEKDDGTLCRVDFGLCDCHGKCYFHSPCRSDTRQAARSKGGRTTAQKGALGTDELPPLSSADAAEVWCDAIGRAAATKRISSSSANAALRAVKEWRESREAGKVSDRLERLMDALSEWRKTGDPEPVLELVDGGGS